MGPNYFRFLRAVEESGTIRQAGKTVGWSYRTCLEPDPPDGRDPRPAGAGDRAGRQLGRWSEVERRRPAAGGDLRALATRHVRLQPARVPKGSQAIGTALPNASGGCTFGPTYSSSKGAHARPIRAAPSSASAGRTAGIRSELLQPACALSQAERVHPGARDVSGKRRAHRAPSIAPDSPLPARVPGNVTWRIQGEFRTGNVGTGRASVSLQDAYVRWTQQRPRHSGRAVQDPVHPRVHHLAHGGRDRRPRDGGGLARAQARHRAHGGLRPRRSGTVSAGIFNGEGQNITANTDSSAWVSPG